MKTLSKSVIAATCLLLIAAPAMAQAPGIDIRLNPRIGLYQPLGDLGQTQVAGVTITEEMSGSLALGLGVELDVMLLPVGLRLNMDYATGSEISRSEDGVEVQAGDAPETTLLAVVGDVMFRPMPKLVLVQPYLFVGGGLKQYDVSSETTTSSFQDGSDPTIHFGGGLDVGFGPLALNAEIGDYVSWYELQNAESSEIQHDLFLTIGFSIGIL